MTGPEVERATKPLRHVHFIGVGGVSMSALALMAQAQGLVVSGSDARRSARTDRLSREGIVVHYGHRAAHVGGADTVVYSTDVPAQNPERRAAEAAGTRLWHRSEMLAWLIADRRALFVTGTHGKTTTTAMVGTIWKLAGLEPTIAVGGDVPGLKWGNAELGSGPWVVAEADESDGSYHRYHPEAVVLTNLEPEHLEHYGGSFQNLQEAMRRFVARIPDHGVLVAGLEDPVVRRVAPAAEAPVVWFGLSPEADVRAVDLELRPFGSRFLVAVGGVPAAEATISVPGRHNVLNALAAIALARQYDIPVTVAVEALRGFSGARRRFEVVSQAGGILVIDDYAVHPTEIATVLDTARAAAAGRVLAVLQPHRYTRAAALWDEMVRATARADEAVVLDVYSPPGELVRPEFGGDRLAEAVSRLVGEPRAHHVSSLELAAAWAEEMAKPGDAIVTLGAGDVWKVAHELARRYQDRAAGRIAPR
jgi:UDP-N-acetylmuramate--alanine ligase